MIGKARFISIDDFTAYMETEEAKEWGMELWRKYFYSRQGEKIRGVSMGTIFDSLCVHSHCGDKFRFPFQDTLAYEEKYQLGYDVEWENDEWDIAILSYGNKAKMCIVPRRFLKIIYYTNYENLTCEELYRLRDDNHYGLANTGEITVADIREMQAKTEEELSSIEENIKKTQDNATDELAKLQREIEEKMAELEDIKNNRLKELAKIKEEMHIKMAGLSQKVYQMDTEIYAIQCFMGETIDFIQLKSGKPAPKTTPVTILQKIRYMDEELAKRMALQNVSYNSHELFEEWLSVHPDAEECFYPTEKCVSVVRVTRTGTTMGIVYDKDGNRLNMLGHYEAVHGKKVGIILRDGENLYMGWTDEDRLTIQSDLFSTKESLNLSSEDAERLLLQTETEKEKQLKEAREKGHFIPTAEQSDIISRYFIFSILQGFVKRDILGLPEGTNLTSQGEYVIYSTADNWIHTTKYGTFTEILEKYKCEDKEGDAILTLLRVRDNTDYVSDYWRQDPRSHGYGRRARGGGIKDRTIYKINLIDIDEYGYISSYISIPLPEKFGTWRNKPSKARANFRLEEDEYLNITYLNTLLIDSILSSQDLGGWKIKSSLVNYSYGAAYLWTAKQYLLARESGIRQFAKELGVDLDEISEWQIAYSDWMKEHNVHKVSQYQVKRFLKSRKLL